MPLTALIADLHIPNPRLPEVASQLVNASPDALILAGDTLDLPTSSSLRSLIRFLEKSAPPRVVAVLGNHEHYLSKNKRRKGANSVEVARWVAERLMEIGVHVLDASEIPIQLGNVWVSGCVGWYDYSLAPEGYASEDFERCNPFGVSLVELELCDIRGRTEFCPKWWRRDCLLVRLPFPHEAYVRKCLEHVRSQLRASGEPRVVVYHHVPRRDLLNYEGGERDFDYAYAGSILLDSPPREYGAEVVVYGHVHERSKSRIALIGGVWYVNAYPFYGGTTSLVYLSVRRGRVRPCSRGEG